MLNLRPIGRVWPKGSFCSAKCTLTIEKVETHFCIVIQFLKNETPLAQRDNELSGAFVERDNRSFVSECYICYNGKIIFDLIFEVFRKDVQF